MIKRLAKITILLLLATHLLTGCWMPSMPAFIPAPTPEQPVFEEPPEYIDQPPTLTAPAHRRFSLRYEPANTMNPIRALNRDNITLSSLLYESLFILDDDLLAHPLLCSKWETEDNVTFTFEIKPGIVMHDGEPMTADDVAYSLRQAMQSGRRHASKLQSISSVESDGELTVTIELDSPNARFIRLLDIPVIRNGTIEDSIPPGSGPYIFPHTDALYLSRFAQHRDYANLPLTTIILRVCNDSDITTLFDEGDLSVLWDDPTGAFDVRLNLLNEPFYYNTTALQFLGFNANSPVVRNPDVRRAIGCAVERQYIVDNIMNVPRPGQTVAAHVAISPVFNMYDPDWEYREQDPLIEMAALIEQAGLQDANQDGFLEAPDGAGGYFSFTLDFIVNIENAHKLAAAERIAESLKQVGFDVNVRVMPWSNFTEDLEKGKFDIYYGETLLGADFDLSVLLLPGDDTLNYGKTANTAYKPMIQSFLAASTQEEVSIAGGNLCREIRIYAPFVPILYKRHFIYSPMGVVSGATPSQSGVFHNFREWSINLEVPT